MLAAAALGFLLWPAPRADAVGGWMAAAGVAPRYETVDGLRLRYVRRGQGPPVVLLHGLAASLYTWKDVLPALAAHHDVIALDLPGFGRSPVPAAGLPGDMSGVVAGVTEVFAVLGLDRPHVAGNSLGGAIALELAAAGRVASATALSPAGFCTPR